MYVLSRYGHSFKQDTSNNASLSEKKSFDIQELIVTPKENPAFVILKKVHKNRRLNNPENITKFKCKEYSQTTLEYDFSKVNDNNSQSLNHSAKQTKDYDAIFVETIYQRSYDKSESHSLKVEATRFPGMKKVAMFLPNDFIQPFHFYDDYILLSDKKYLNPIGDRNFSRYYFHLKDSMIIDGTLTYIIDYRPKSELSYEGLQGTLIISSDKWAIQTVTAKPLREDNTMVSILQNYKQIDGQWFPLELNYELRFVGASHIPPFGYIGKSYISNVEIGDEVSFSKPTQNQIEVMDGSANRDSIYWKQNRPIELSPQQKSMYTSIDTLVNFDKIPFVIEKIAELKIPVKIFDIDLTKLYSKNDFEGERFGFGLATNERLSERVSLGGFFLYGNKDKAFKYGGNIELNIAKKTNFKTNISYNHSYIKEDYFKPTSNSNISNPSSIYNQDFLTEYRIEFKNNLRRFNLNYYAASQSFKTYSEITNLNNLTEDIFAGGVHIDFDYYRKNMTSWISPYKSINASSVVDNRHIPTLEMLFEKGFVFDKYNYDYAKLQLEINSSFYLTKLGRIHYSLQTGKTWGDLAVSKLFRGGRSYAKDATLLFEDAFQTVSQNEFSNSEYIYLFMNYKFGTINFKSKYTLPQVVLYQNFGLGKNNDSYIFQETEAMDKLLLESGLGIENIMRISIANVFYLGGGAAVFYRYGEHAITGNIENNISYRAILTLGF